MSAEHDQEQKPHVIAVSISSGGVPKIPQNCVELTTDGLVGDGRDHDKHIKPSRAVSLFDEELMHKLCDEGYDLTPGRIGENLTLRNVNVQGMEPGTLLRIGEVVLRLEEPRRPCFVLDALDEKLKDDIVGRCGYMASVVQEGELRPGLEVETVEA